MPRHRWPPYLATGLLIAAAILWMAYTSFATDVNVTQSARCVSADTGRYDVTVTAHNSYDQALHIVVNNPASPIAVTLAPSQTWSYTFHVTADSWTVKVTSPVAVLHGDTSRTWTLEDVCGLPVTTTTSPPTTTCAQANPPRADCIPPTTVPLQLTPLPPCGPDTTTPCDTIPPTSAVAPPESTPSSPDGPVLSPPATAAPRPPTSVARPITLPVTGSDWVGVVGAAAGLIIGGGIVLIATRRRP